MDKVNSKRLFSAELRQLKAKGLAGANGSDGQASDLSLAIDVLRQEIRDLGQLIRDGGNAAGPAAPAGPLPDEKSIEVNQLKTEIRALALAIDHTKAEIAALRPQNAEDDRLVAVTNELDAIVSSTERATHTILEAAEKLDGLAQQLHAQVDDGFLGRLAEDMRDTIVSIFEACNFQDITGQRITKVVRTLQFIEERVNRMMDIWGRETFQDLAPPPEVQSDDEKRLLNGPALENQGISQADIDKLFG